MGLMHLHACHECDTLHRTHKLVPGNTARCQCCGAILLRHPKGGLERSIALNITALILLFLANIFPLLTLEFSGLQQSTTLTGAALGLYDKGLPVLAILVFFTSVVGPVAVVLTSLYVLLGVHYSWRLPKLRTTLVWISRVSPWGMLDVFLLGILVSFEKLTTIADVVIGPAMIAFVCLIAVSAVTTIAYEPALLWRKLGFPEHLRHAR